MEHAMSYLIVNCGTATVKMTLFSKDGKVKKKVKMPSQSCEEAITEFKTTSLQAIGHRVVHGGEKYVQSTLITPDVESDLQALIELAPLHNPPAIAGIETCKRLFPNVPQVAVFDTAFHSTIPPKAAFYPIPWQLSQKYKIKRYGFHGIAHAYDWTQYSQTQNPKKRVITVHLGSGCSITAIENGVSIDTSMGFTPLDGLMMATRSGALDPAIVSYLCEKEKKSPDEVVSLLNHQSGLLGICGEADMQKILSSNNAQTKLALEMFVYHIQKQIGAFIAILGGVDAILFSGGIGENSPHVRQKVMQAWREIPLDEKKNQSTVTSGEIVEIHDKNSNVAVFVVGCDENQFIFEEIISLESLQYKHHPV